MNTGRPVELPGGRAGAASQAETTAGADASATAAAATMGTASVTPPARARPCGHDPTGTHAMDAEASGGSGDGRRDEAVGRVQATAPGVEVVAQAAAGAALPAGGLFGKTV